MLSPLSLAFLSIRWRMILEVIRMKELTAQKVMRKILSMRVILKIKLTTKSKEVAIVVALRRSKVS
jgi:hypothetical protein